MNLKIVPAEIAERAKNAPGSNEYLALRIAGQQSTWRDAAFRSAERVLRERMSHSGLSSRQQESWFLEQFASVKQLVEQIDSCQDSA